MLYFTFGVDLLIYFILGHMFYLCAYIYIYIICYDVCIATLVRNMQIYTFYFHINIVFMFKLFMEFMT